MVRLFASLSGAVLSVAFPSRLLSQDNAILTQTPGGIIDGSRTPELIPDKVAYRFIFLSLALPPSPTDLEIHKQRQRISRMDLSKQGVDKLGVILDAFSRDYSEWRARLYSQGLAGPGHGPTGSVPMDEILRRRQLASEKDELIQRYRDLVVAQLTPEDGQKFRQYVINEKRKMQVAVRQ